MLKDSFELVFLKYWSLLGTIGDQFVEAIRDLNLVKFIAENILLKLLDVVAFCGRGLSRLKQIKFGKWSEMSSNITLLKN
jgi:hypothetical protein